MKNVIDFQIGELLTKQEGGEYLIPIYQRNYAWEDVEINQLIQDVWDFAEKEKNEKDKQPYYIGTLVTHFHKEGEQKHKYEVLDGQQRLTTLYILMGVLKSLGQTIPEGIIKKLNLHFEAREKSTKTLKNILKGKALKNILKGKAKGKQASIIDGFTTAKEYLEEKIKKENFETFTEYLLNNVKLVRTIVPPDTDLNHYFEIMNNRGEQLEKHEILKAQLLNAIHQGKNENNKLVFQYAKVWDACSQMDSYVQMNFSPKNKKENEKEKKDTNDRFLLFGERWDSLDVEKISEIGSTGDNEKSDKNDIISIINGDKVETKEENNNDSERFESIIDFPNFLLQVLKVTKETKDKKVSLDDKKLLQDFDNFKDDEGFAKEFIQNLLKYRFWFDKYVIKRDGNNEGDWSLKSWIKNKDNNYPKNTFSKDDTGDEENKGINKQITMIQSMFHVSNQSKSNKTWLNKFFEEFTDKENITLKEPTLEGLEKISRELFTQKDNLDKLKYKGDFHPTPYTFNLLDYVIWKEKNKKEEDQQENLRAQLKKIPVSFSFKGGRNSVEHFYPQNDDYSQKDHVTKEYVHQFGNLGLVTHSLNSAFSNKDFSSKKNKINNNKESYSLKLLLMAQQEEWKNKAIKNHQEKMIALLKKYLGEK